MSKTAPPVLTGPRVVLRRSSEGDAAQRLILGRDPEISRMNGDDPNRPFSHDNARDDVHRWDGSPTAWSIILDDRYIGGVRLHPVPGSTTAMRLAITIHDRSQIDQGLGTEAVAMVLKHAFDALHLESVHLRVLSFNARAIASYERNGFRERVQDREAIVIRGETCDDLLMEITRDRWLNGNVR